MDLGQQAVFFNSHNVGEMTITQGMKEIQLIHKKIEHNSKLITKYCVQPSNERPHLETEDLQKKEVLSLIHTNGDLIQLALVIRIAINYTNIVTKVELENSSYTIEELLLLKRTYGKYWSMTYQSLNENSVAATIRGNKDLSIVRYFNEEMKNRNERIIMDLMGRINGTLELVNATTKLLFPQIY